MTLVYKSVLAEYDGLIFNDEIISEARVQH